MTVALNEEGAAGLPTDDAMSLNTSMVGEDDTPTAGSQWITPLQQYNLGWDIFPMLGNQKGAYAHFLPDGGTQPTKWVDGWTRLTEDQVKALWPGDGRHNIGVATGRRSGVWVLDVDVVFETEAQAREYVGELTGIEIPQTLSVRTASGKWHFYFKMPDSPDIYISSSVGKIAPNVDVRGDGGMAMGICSSVTGADGETSYYEVATMAAPVYAPLPLVERVKRKDIVTSEAPVASTEKRVDVKASQIAEAHMIEPELQKLRDLPRPWHEGAQWHNTCFEVACQLAEFANSAWCALTIEEARRRFFEAAPGPEKDWNPTKEWEEGVAKTAGQARPLPKVSDEADAAAAALMAAAQTRPSAPKPEITGTLRDRLDATRATYRKWMGEHYDMDAADLALCARAAHELDGENVWVLILSGPGNAKTETIMPIGATAAHQDDDDSWTKVVTVSDISGPAALLSGSSKKETAADATGGLLADLGTSGVMVLKDFTTVLSMHRDKRAEILAAFREIYDGSYSRLLGTDGGQALGWAGSMTLIGATTSAYDSAHSVIASMGDRFALLRVDSESRPARIAATRQARRNTGRETEMRTEMAEAVRTVVAGIDRSAAEVDLETLDALDALADVVTMIRTAVEFDQGERNAVRAHAPEVGTRFGKMLVQIVRAGLAIGMTRDEALALATRVGRDSATPIRVDCLKVLAEHGALTSYAAAQVLEKPRATVDRAMQALQLLGFVKYREGNRVLDGCKDGAWVWSIAPDWADAPSILGIAS